MYDWLSSISNLIMLNNINLDKSFILKPCAQNYMHWNIDKYLTKKRKEKIAFVHNKVIFPKNYLVYNYQYSLTSSLTIIYSNVTENYS